MKAAYDELITTAVKRQHEPQQIVGDLLNAEISEKQARSIKYQMTIAKLPLAKEVDEFTFEDTPVNETLVRDLAAGDFLDQQRNVVLIGGTGNRPKLVLEAGGVDRPLLDRSPDYEFVGLDIEERPECARLYDRFLIQSIEDPLPVEPDMILSYTLLEHVPENHAALGQIYAALKPGGTTHHYVPSKYHPYSLGLRLIGPSLQKRLIPILRPGTEDITGYPAFFDLCSAHAMARALERQGFTNVDVQAFYRANDYFAFFTPLFVLVTLFENLCHKHDWRVCASGFVISAQKP